MPTQLDLKRRIRSVRNTQQITRAMKFVAAARLRRAQERALSARPYARALGQLVHSIAERAPAEAHPLLQRRPEEGGLLLMVSGERGLCGAFNANVTRKAIEFLRGRRAEEMQIITLGRKGRDAMRKHAWKIAGEYVDVTARPDHRHAHEITEKILRLYSDGEIDAVYLLFNEFKSVLAQTLTLEKILPIEAGGRGEAGTPETAADYIYEEPPAELFARILPRYVEVQVFRALAESSAAEHAARMTAMDSATNNAADLIDQLTLYMNKVRQAAITKEIIEVVSGAASAG